MKFKSLTFASIAAAVLALSSSVWADEKAAAESNAAPARHHSHVQEKSGVAQTPPADKKEKKGAAKDKSKHLHPRDGK